jgi:hypothetical protein
MNTLTLLVVCTALGAEPPTPTPLVGTSVSGGQSPLRITVTETAEQRRRVQVYWPAFEATTMDQVVETSGTCTEPRLADGAQRLDLVERCVLQRIDDRHPTYAYTSKTLLMCVFGKHNGGEAAACKLQYSGWFDLVPEPAAASERTPAPLED